MIFTAPDTRFLTRWPARSRLAGCGVYFARHCERQDCNGLRSAQSTRCKADSIRSERPFSDAAPLLQRAAKAGEGTGNYEAHWLQTASVALRIAGWQHPFHFSLAPRLGVREFCIVQRGDSTLHSKCKSDLHSQLQRRCGALLNTSRQAHAVCGVVSLRVASSAGNRAGDFPCPLNPVTVAGHTATGTWRAVLRGVLVLAVAPDQNSVTNSPHRTSQENVRASCACGNAPLAPQIVLRSGGRATSAQDAGCSHRENISIHKRTEPCGFPLTFHFREWTARCLHQTRLAVNRLSLLRVNALTSFRGAFRFSAFYFRFACPLPHACALASTSILAFYWNSTQLELNS